MTDLSGVAAVNVNPLVSVNHLHSLYTCHRLVYRVHTYITLM